MPLVTLQRYRDLTGDQSTDETEVTARVEDATDLLEEELGGRLLRSEERTEQVLLYEIPEGYGGWRAYPLATPITGIDPAASYRIEDTVTLSQVSPDATPFWIYPSIPTGTVVYTGGYTSDTVPFTLEKAIADLARALGQPTPSSAAFSGAARVGDVSVTLPEQGGGIDFYVPGLSARICKYRRRRQLSAPDPLGAVW